EPGSTVADPVFSMNGVNTRQVMTRNSPSMINSALLFRLPWDGKFNHVFNGATGFGPRDPNGKILVDDGAGLQEAHVAIDNAAVASLSLAVPGNTVAMHADGPAPKHLARHLPH